MLELLVLLLQMVAVKPDQNGKLSRDLLTEMVNQDLSLPLDYNRHLRPQHKGPRDDVMIGLQIYSIGPVSESDMTMQIDMYFRMTWHDHRLAETYKYLVTDNASNHYLDSLLNKANITVPTVLDPITLGEEYAEAIWSPDIYFPDAVNIERPGKDLISDSMVLALYSDTRVFQSMRLQMKIRCKLALKLFPMDIQTCEICLESYQYHSADMNISWWEGRLEMDVKKMQKYGVANFHIDYHPWLENYTRSAMAFGFEYVTLCVEVRLIRKLSIFLVTMYLPSISLVALSWVGFWIDKRAVPARASLTITTILAQITLITGTANQFPGIADLKVADLYLIINFFFVFASLIEFALVSYEPPVKTLAKSWLQNTRDKLRTSQPNPSASNNLAAKLKAASSERTPQYGATPKPSIQLPDNQTISPNHQIAENLPRRKIAHANGMSTTGRGSPASGSPVSRRMAMAQRERHLSVERSHREASNNSRTPSPGRRFNGLSGERTSTDEESHSPLLQRRQLQRELSNQRSPARASQPNARREVAAATCVYSGRAGDEFLEIKDFSARKPSDKGVSSILFHEKPLDTVITLDAMDKVAGLKNKEPAKKSRLKLLSLEPFCRLMKKIPCLKPLIEYFQSDKFSKDNADSVSKWLFPLVFTIWNVLYFGITMTIAGRFSEWPMVI